MDAEEDLILARIKKRDKEAFRYLYEYYFAKMVLFAESYLYDEEEAREVWREDAREEGLEEGRKEGRKEGIKEGTRVIVKKLARNKTPEIIAQELDEPLEFILELLAETQEEVC